MGRHVYPWATRWVTRLADMWGLIVKHDHNPCYLLFPGNLICCLCEQSVHQYITICCLCLFCCLKCYNIIYWCAVYGPDGSPIGSGDPTGTGMGLRSDPWTGSWAETFAHLLYGHGSGIGRPAQYPTHCRPYLDPCINVNVTLYLNRDNYYFMEGVTVNFMPPIKRFNFSRRPCSCLI